MSVYNNIQQGKLKTNMRWRYMKRIFHYKWFRKYK